MAIVRRPSLDLAPAWFPRHAWFPLRAQFVRLAAGLGQPPRRGAAWMLGVHQWSFPRQIKAGSVTRPGFDYAPAPALPVAAVMCSGATPCSAREWCFVLFAPDMCEGEPCQQARCRLYLSSVHCWFHVKHRRGRSGPWEDHHSTSWVLALALAEHAANVRHRVVHHLALERCHWPQPDRLAGCQHILRGLPAQLGKLSPSRYPPARDVQHQSTAGACAL